MSAGDGYELDPAALQQITKGINATISELKELGIDANAQVGKGFSDIELTGMETGHAGLTSTFASFCERWDFAVRQLVLEANEIARRLDLSAGMYHEQEQYASGLLKIGVNAAMGDPTLTSDQIKERTWGQIGSDNPFTQFRDLDWNPNSTESREAFERTRQAWNATGNSIYENGREVLNRYGADLPERKPDTGTTDNAQHDGGKG